MEPKNLIVFMSDEHTRSVTGCYGHDIVRTPNIDRLAQEGARFDAAYTPCPICVPARGAFATGKYVHQLGYWDNAAPFHGEVPSWHSILRERGHQTVSIGKLHFRSADDDNGFSDERIGMHVIDGKGDLMGLVRDDDIPRRGGSWKMAGMAGPGESVYTTYDRDITARAQVWLREEAPKFTDKPWVLFVSLVCPHFPLTAPPEHFFHYHDQDLPLPKLYERRHQSQHPFIEDYRRSLVYDEFFDTPDKLKRAQAGYLGLVSFVDENIGKVLAALDDAGLRDDTRVVYTTDHGDNLGNRGLWGKSVMYEEAAAYMIRKGTHKLIYHVDYPLQLFDLAADPEELNDLADDPGVKPVIDELVTALFRICDPTGIDRRAKCDQAAMMAAAGGREAVIARGDLGFSVPPGIDPMFD